MARVAQNWGILAGFLEEEPGCCMAAIPITSTPAARASAVRTSPMVWILSRSIDQRKGSSPEVDCCSRTATSWAGRDVSGSNLFPRVQLVDQLTGLGNRQLLGVLDRV